MSHQLLLRESQERDAGPYLFHLQRGEAELVAAEGKTQPGQVLAEIRTTGVLVVDGGAVVDGHGLPHQTPRGCESQERSLILDLSGGASRDTSFATTLAGASSGDQN